MYSKYILIRLISVSIIWISCTSACTKDAKEIGVCLHSYLERDFLSISMIVYPKHKDCRSHRSGGPELEGPELAHNCHNIGEVLECFTGVLKKCHYMEDFFKYRELLASLEEIYHWVCGDKRNLRERLGGVLYHYSCIEQMVFEKTCKRDEIKSNIWNEILRLEKDTQVCSALKEQQRCVLDSQEIIRYSKDAHYVYKNMSTIFLDRWCSSAFAHRPSLIMLIILSCIALSSFRHSV